MLVRGAMYDYQKPDRGWCGDPGRGAAMGRSSDLPLDTHEPLTIRRVPIVDGYDPGGTYWGEPNDLFCVFDGDGRVHYLRAESCEAAKAEFPHAEFPLADEVSEADLADMLAGYVRCALWSSVDDDKPMDETCTEDDLAPSTLEELRRIVETFARENAALLLPSIGKRGRATGRECDWSLAGHDLWLTQAETGAGFGDGDWPETVDRKLYEAAGRVERLDLYVGDDGKVYC
jgi:hypothetical protein